MEQPWEAWNATPKRLHGRDGEGCDVFQGRNDEFL